MKIFNMFNIGLRSFYFSDILIRTLQTNDFQVKTIQNITDVNDKIIKKPSGKSVSIYDLTKDYEKGFLENTESINILERYKLPHATKKIDILSV